MFSSAQLKNEWIQISDVVLDNFLNVPTTKRDFGKVLQGANYLQSVFWTLNFAKKSLK